MTFFYNSDVRLAMYVMFDLLYVRVGILLICGNHLDDRHLVISAPIYIRHLLKSTPSQFGTCHGQFGTSVKHNFVIIKYLYIKKRKKVGFIS